MELNETDRMNTKSTPPNNGIPHLELKVGLVLLLTLFLAVLFVGYLVYSRGMFEESRELTLTTPDSSGVTTGMPVSLAGQPVGQVIRAYLTPEGKAAIVVKVREKDMHWLRQGSSFWLEKNLLGSATISVRGGKPDEPPLDMGTTHPLQEENLSNRLPVIVERIAALADNLERMSRPDASLAQSLNHVAQISGNMTGEHGVMNGLLGKAGATKVSTALDSTNNLLNSLHGASLKISGTLEKADHSVETLNGALIDARTSLKRVDAILANVQSAATDIPKITGDARIAAAHVREITQETQAATRDLNLLRRDVDDSLAKVNHLINELNRKWPFARNMELKTP